MAATARIETEQDNDPESRPRRGRPKSAFLCQHIRVVTTRTPTCCDASMTDRGKIKAAPAPRGPAPSTSATWPGHQDGSGVCHAVLYLVRTWPADKASGRGAGPGRPGDLPAVATRPPLVRVALEADAVDDTGSASTSRCPRQSGGPITQRTSFAKLQRIGKAGPSAAKRDSRQ